MKTKHLQLSTQMHIIYLEVEKSRIIYHDLKLYLHLYPDILNSLLYQNLKCQYNIVGLVLFLCHSLHERK